MGRQVVIPQRSAHSGAEGGAAADADKKEGAYWSRELVVPSRSRQVSRFWLEKALVLTDGVQLFALMWQLSQPWPWPARWLEATRWVNAFTLDVFSFRATGAAMGSTSQPFSLWGEMPNYWLYALVWALVPWSGVLALQMAKRSWARQGRSDCLLLSVTWENVLLQIMQFLYVPVGLAVLRLVNCDADGAVSVDPTGMSCGGPGHVAAVLLVTCGLGGGFLVGLPWMLRRCIRDSMVHTSVEKHERFVRGKELEFILGTSDSYLELSMPQFASFRRHSVEMPVQMCLSKLALMLDFSVLRSPPPSMANQGIQGSLFVMGVVTMAVYRTWRYPYRCKSTSYLAILVDWMLVANGVFVLLCANGVRSALTVSTSVTSSLTFLNSCFLVVIGLVELRDIMLLSLHSERSKTIELLWPTNAQMKEIVEFGPQVSSWVNTIHNAQNAILASLLVIPSMRSYEDLKKALDQVEICYEEAARSDHLLMGQLYELSLYVNELYVEAVASSPFHRNGSPTTELADLTGVLQRRKDRQVLLSTRSQRVLKKLHIARSWSRQTQSYASANTDRIRNHNAVGHVTTN
ncbi:hypothetical protein PHYSODRAFT_318559 [Phytophthora sojae]|uniref:Uncharacterized protein n=1 Tax=Phytophthora sojae (strain P6497) TaxID=1094619 RepID=G5A3Z5_PHYSP|nr:hypothetical protein PHYSODRAFT_318559 [Phytophthora sojae]EGZ10255.1 hypothetical protein PHYSODRAFT_318559 [Phytophthora sojae]|eukprot:XP_009535116.1 hypothetical protein PHYSODRAFT_318559 [Phytophthora sojae]